MLSLSLGIPTMYVDSAAFWEFENVVPPPGTELNKHVQGSVVNFHFCRITELLLPIPNTSTTSGSSR